MEIMKKIVISLLLLASFGLQAVDHPIGAAKALIALSRQGSIRPCPPPAALDDSDYQIISLIGDNGTSVSSSEKPFACPQCKYRTAQKGHLTRHIKTHTGEKLYKCTVCDKSFARNDTLIRHMNNHINQQPPK